MKELIDFKRVWDWLCDRWAESFGCVVLIMIAFFIGMVVQEKLITEDCRFMGSFRDGAQAYNCQARVR